jgi:hypothetical protein
VIDIIEKVNLAWPKVCRFWPKVCRFLTPFWPKVCRFLTPFWPKVCRFLTPFWPKVCRFLTPCLIHYMGTLKALLILGPKCLSDSFSARFIVDVDTPNFLAAEERDSPALSRHARNSAPVFGTSGHGGRAVKKCPSRGASLRGGEGVVKGDYTTYQSSIQELSGSILVPRILELLGGGRQVSEIIALPGGFEPPTFGLGSKSYCTNVTSLHADNCSQITDIVTESRGV